VGTGSYGNSLTLLNNAVWDLNGRSVTLGLQGVGGSPGVKSSNNTIYVLSGGILSNGVVRIGTNSPTFTRGTDRNSLIVSNGGLVVLNGLMVGSSLNNANGGNQIYTNNYAYISNITIAASSQISTGGISIGNQGGIGNTGVFQNVMWNGVSSGGGTLEVGSGRTANTIGNALVIQGGSQVTNFSLISVGRAQEGFGYAFYNNSLLVSGAGTMLSASNGLGVAGDIRVGLVEHNGSADSITVGPNAYAAIPGGISSNNLLKVSAGASVKSVNLYVGAYFSDRTSQSNNLSIDNSVIVDGGTWTNSGDVIIGAALTYGTANGSLGGGVRLNTMTASNNALVLLNGSMLTTTNLVLGYVALGGSNNSAAVNQGSSAVIGGNRVVISNNASLYTKDLSLGFIATGNLGTNVSITGNSVLVTSGGLLEATTMRILTNIVGFTIGGNTISNRNGIYQFATASPTIAPNGAGSIAITDGTISFRGITDADVTNNLGQGALSGITFAGDNTFMLNAASNTTAGQTYTFQSVVGNPSNYVNLAMVNGTTAYRGGDLTIGSTGSLLVSNTSASITGLFTNQGMANVVNATAIFSQGIANEGVLALRNGTVTGGLTIQAGGTLQGNGFINGDVLSSGTISPGFSIGTLSITGDLTLAGSAITVMELAADGVNDLLDVSQLFTYGGELVVTNITGFTFANGQTFQLFEFGTQIGSFSATNLPDLTPFGLTWYTGQLETQGLLIVVPEPSTIVLLGGGLLMLCCVSHVRRRRR